MIMASAVKEQVVRNLFRSSCRGTATATATDVDIRVIVRFRDIEHKRLLACYTKRHVLFAVDLEKDVEDVAKNWTSNLQILAGLARFRGEARHRD